MPNKKPKYIKGQYKQVKGWLYDYPDMLISIVNLKKLYKVRAMESIGAVITDGIGSGKTNLISSTTENMAITLTEITDLQAYFEDKVEMIKNALPNLSDMQYKLIECKYFKLMTGDEILDKLFISQEKQLFRIEKRALKKLDLMLFGIRHDHNPVQ